MEIRIGINGATSDLDKYEEDVSAELEDEDLKVYELLKGIVDGSSEVQASDFKILKKTDDYYTAQLFDYDWIRWHFGKRSKWFSMCVAEDDREDDLFEDAENKNQAMWKMRIDEADDLSLDYYDALYNRFYEIIDAQ